jgi:hypothetical protein
MSEKSDALAVPVDVTMLRPTLFGVPAMPILAAPRHCQLNYKKKSKLQDRR